MANRVKSLFKKLEMHMASPTDAMAPSTKPMAPDPDFAPFDLAVAEIFRHRKHVGVNLGGVFCLEGWLAPPTLRSTALRQGWQSEIDFLEACPSREAARDALEDHWQHWGVTENDFRYLASVGINAVRVPIGYWIVAGRDPELVTSPFKKYLGVYDTALHWLLVLIDNAAKHDIGVLVDVHGAPGGQNSDSHCGISTHQAHFLKFGSQNNRAVMLKVYQKLARLLAPINNVIGLELLNEPQDDAALASFYHDAIKAIRNVVPDIRLPIYIGDCWNADKYSDFIAAASSNPLDFLVLDTHQYFCHTPADHAKSADQHAKHLTTGLKTGLAQNARRIRGNLVVGEWSVVLNNASIPADEHDGQVMKAFGENELKVWNDVAAGQFYWNYKTMDDGWYWSFVYCQKNHILPSNMGGFIVATATANDTYDEQKEAWLKEAFDKHVQYWSSQDGGQAVVHEAWQFKKGFEVGYSVAMRFVERQSRIGFAEQLAAEYTAQHQSGQQAWQFEHGFIQSVCRVNESCIID